MRKSIRKMSAPLRVYWDLVPEESGGLGRERAAMLAAELAVLKVFFVTIGLTGGGRPDLPEISAALKKGGVRVTVSFGDKGSFPGWGVLGPVDGVELRADDHSGFGGLLGTVMDSAPEGMQVSVSLVPERDGAAYASEAIAMALDLGVRAFKLSNPDIVNKPGRAQKFVIDDTERALYKRELEGLLMPYGEGVRLDVHDLFLHRSLGLPGLGGRIEYAGCQGGDAIAYIHGTGIVYPCSSWPLPLGDLADSTLKEIWSGPIRDALVEVIRDLPRDCVQCPDSSVCMGGCRGMAQALGGEGAKDPGCGM